MIENAVRYGETMVVNCIFIRQWTTTICNRIRESFILGHSILVPFICVVNSSPFPSICWSNTKGPNGRLFRDFGYCNKWSPVLSTIVLSDIDFSRKAFNSIHRDHTSHHSVNNIKMVELMRREERVGGIRYSRSTVQVSKSLLPIQSKQNQYFSFWSM